MDENKKPSQSVDLAQSRVNAEIEELRRATKLQEVKEPKGNQSPPLGLQHSKSFSKFRNAFEDGLGVMDENKNPSQSMDHGQRKVNAEIEALKSSSKIQNMFRIYNT
jgi:hypothetical protein